MMRLLKKICWFILDIYQFWYLYGFQAWKTHFFAFWKASIFLAESSPLLWEKVLKFGKSAFHVKFSRFIASKSDVFSSLVHTWIVLVMMKVSWWFQIRNGNDIFHHCLSSFFSFPTNEHKMGLNWNEKGIKLEMMILCRFWIQNGNKIFQCIFFIVVKTLFMSKKFKRDKIFLHDKSLCFDLKNRENVSKNALHLKKEARFLDFKNPEIDSLELIQKNSKVHKRKKIEKFQDWSFCNFWAKESKTCFTGQLKMKSRFLGHPVISLFVPFMTRPGSFQPLHVSFSNTL